VRPGPIRSRDTRVRIFSGCRCRSRNDSPILKNVIRMLAILSGNALLVKNVPVAHNVIIVAIIVVSEDYYDN
jgi:hypothetical protein